MREYAIQSYRSGTRLNDRNLPVRTVIVRFTVHGQGPFEREFDQDTFGADAVDKELTEFAASLKQIGLPPAQP